MMLHRHLICFIFCLPGTIKLDMSPVHDTPLACLSTELIPMVPVAEKNIRPVKEVLEFPSSEVYVPHNIYRCISQMILHSIFSTAKGNENLLKMLF